MKDREPLMVGKMTPAFVKANPDGFSSLLVRTPPLRNNSYFILQIASHPASLALGCYLPNRSTTSSTSPGNNVLQQ